MAQYGLRESHIGDGRMEEDFLETNSPKCRRLSSDIDGHPAGYGKQSPNNIIKIFFYNKESFPWKLCYFLSLLNKNTKT